MCPKNYVYGTAKELFQKPEVVQLLSLGGLLDPACYLRAGPRPAAGRKLLQSTRSNSACCAASSIRGAPGRSWSWRRSFSAAVVVTADEFTDPRGAVISDRTAISAVRLPCFLSQIICQCDFSTESVKALEERRRLWLESCQDTSESAEPIVEETTPLPTPVAIASR